jgi:hypothetical protein
VAARADRAILVEGNLKRHADNIGSAVALARRLATGLDGNADLEVVAEDVAGDEIGRAQNPWREDLRCAGKDRLLTRRNEMGLEESQVNPRRLSVSICGVQQVEKPPWRGLPSSRPLTVTSHQEDRPPAQVKGFGSVISSGSLFSTAHASFTSGKSPAGGPHPR